MSFDVGGPSGAVAQLRRLLTDQGRCPGCAAVLPGERCAACGIDLSGPVGAHLLQLSRVADEVLGRREMVLEELRGWARQAASAPQTQPQVRPGSSSRSQPGPSSQPQSRPGPRVRPGPGFLPGSGPVPGKPLYEPVFTPAPPRPRPAWLSVNTVLVGVGALLLAVAAIGFLIFSWASIPLAGRAAVIGTATLAALGISAWLRPRLPETAEAVGALGVVLVLGDAWAIRSTGLFGAGEPRPWTYGGWALLLSGALIGAWAWKWRMRAGSHAAVVLLPVGASVLTSSLLTLTVDAPMAPGLLVGALVTLARRRLPPAWRSERTTAQVIAAVALVLSLQAVVLANLHEVVLTLLAIALVTAAQTGADASAPVGLRRTWSTAAGFVAVLTAVFAALDLARALGFYDAWAILPVTLLPALLLTGLSRLPQAPDAALRRIALGAGVLTGSVLTLLPSVAVAAVAVFGPYGQSSRSVSAVIDHDIDLTSRLDTSIWGVALGSFAIVAAATGIAARGPLFPGFVRRRLRSLSFVLTAVALLLITLIPPVPLIGNVALLIALATASAVLVVRDAEPPAPVLWTLSVFSGLHAVFLSWTTRELPVPITLLAIGAVLLARRRLTLRPLARAALAVVATGALPLVLVTFLDQIGSDEEPALVWTALVGGLLSAGLLTVPRLPVPPRARWDTSDRIPAAVPGLIALAVGLGTSGQSGYEPGWHLTLLLALTLATVIAGAVRLFPAAAAAFPIVPPLFAVTTTPLLGLLAWSLDGLDPLDPGLVWAFSTAVGAAVVTVLVLTGRLDRDRRIGAEAGLAVTGLVALAATGDVGRLWLTLLVVGVSATAIALTPDRTRVGWLAGALLMLSSWTRLWDADVRLVEAYTLPPALVLLGIQFWARRRRAREVGPEPVLLTPFVLGVLPSVLASGGGTLVRPVVLMVLAGVVVLVATRFGSSPFVRPALLGAAVTGVATALLRAGANLDETPLSLTDLEVWTVPAAVLLLVQGRDRFAAVGENGTPRSWVAFAPGLVLLLGPGLLFGVADGGSQVARPSLVILLAAGVTAAGAHWRLQAPLLLGSAALVIQAVVLLSPWMRTVGATVPLWAWAAIVGLALLVLGGGYEKRLNQLRSVRARVAALR
ncbi:SCO7613 C-terminal domain-containing membrane protein [Kineosporia succinea]|uniref:Membrane protein DUF2157 n=1 Tax=Kineosporia succinea TaxID=84632 RepID=A0ABT9NVG6_9ACTN|nr:hypothetical protein [Kineosporia succinea]MDP9824422.1 hypothetical protein [Kineosporia succinea]